MNVFVRCWPESALRRALMTAVIERVSLEGARVVLIAAGPDVAESLADVCVDAVIMLSTEDFHRESKRAAAIYWDAPQSDECEHLIIVDDDQLPLYRDWVGYAVSLTKRYPEYVAIAGWSVTNEVPRPESLIAESDSIGCPMIVKRSALLDATSEAIDNPQRADTILTQRLQRHGKTGIARNWRYNHLGFAYSQVIPAHWMPECPA